MEHHNTSLKNPYWTSFVFQISPLCCQSYGLLFLFLILPTPSSLQILGIFLLICANQPNFRIALAPNLKISALPEVEDSVLLPGSFSLGG